MLGIVLAFVLASVDPVSAAVESYKNTASYSVTLDSKGSGSSEIIKYYFKKPGFIRMEFIKPHSGAVLVYDPYKREVRLRPFGFMKSLVIRLRPEDSLIRSSGGHTVDESDIGSLLKRVARLQKNGETKALKDEDAGGRPALPVSVEGRGGETVDGINRYILWLDKKNHLPLKVEAFDAGGRLVEEVLMEDLDLNPDLPEDFFFIGRD